MITSQHIRAIANKHNFKCKEMIIRQDIKALKGHKKPMLYILRDKGTTLLDLTEILCEQFLASVTEERHQCLLVQAGNLEPITRDRALSLVRDCTFVR